MKLDRLITLDKPLTMEIKGRNLIEGVPKTITIDDSEIREALTECISTIMNAIRVALERTPPELSADISDRGIVLTGGGALIKNLDKRIREETGLAGVDCGRSAGQRGAGHGQDVERLPTAAEDQDRLTYRGRARVRAAAVLHAPDPLLRVPFHVLAREEGTMHTRNVNRKYGIISQPV